jgi:hypothetical protein
MTDPLVEAAKAVHRTFGMLEPHPDDCAFCEPILSALRAAQAEAERRYTALKAECDADHPPEPWASELQAKLDAAERRAQEAEAQLGRVPAIIHAVLDEAGAERHGEVEPERYGIPPGTKHGSKGWRSMTRGRGTWKWRILRLGKAAARAAAHP